MCCSPNHRNKRGHKGAPPERPRSSSLLGLHAVEPSPQNTGIELAAKHLALAWETGFPVPEALGAPLPPWGWGQGRRIGTGTFQSRRGGGAAAVGLGDAFLMALGTMASERCVGTCSSLKLRAQGSRLGKSSFTIIFKTELSGRTKQRWGSGGTGATVQPAARLHSPGPAGWTPEQMTPVLHLPVPRPAAQGCWTDHGHPEAVEEET